MRRHDRLAHRAAARRRCCVRADRHGLGRAGRCPGSGPPCGGAGDPARLQSGLDPLRRLVRWARLSARARPPGHGWRLPRQPCRNARAQHHTPPLGGTGQDAPVQRPALELGAPRHPRAAARAAAHPWPSSAEGGGADPAYAAATRCDRTARGRRDRALLLIGFAGALRRSELVTLQVEDVALAADGLRLRVARAKTDQAGQGAEIGLPRGRHAETCPARAFEDWQAVARRKAGPLFRRISTAGRIGDTGLHPDAVRRILAHWAGLAGLEVDGFGRLSAHALRAGFITEAYAGASGTRTSCAIPGTATRAPCAATSSAPTSWTTARPGRSIWDRAALFVGQRSDTGRGATDGSPERRAAAKAPRPALDGQLRPAYLRGGSVLALPPDDQRAVRPGNSLLGGRARVGRGSMASRSCRGRGGHLQPGRLPAAAPPHPDH